MISRHFEHARYTPASWVQIPRGLNPALYFPNGMLLNQDQNCANRGEYRKRLVYLLKILAYLLKIKIFSSDDRILCRTTFWDVIVNYYLVPVGTTLWGVIV
jgi:hypothetical protein